MQDVSLMFAVSQYSFSSVIIAFAYGDRDSTCSVYFSGVCNSRSSD